jgi:hypothetical protein
MGDTNLSRGPAMTKSDRGNAEVLTDLVREMFEAFADVDLDIRELGEILNGRDAPSWRAEFLSDLSAAISRDELTPDVVNELTARRFTSEESLNRWLRQAWSIWFPGERYPD